MSKVIQSAPDILAGTPVFRGTRVPAQALFDYLEDGKSIDDFLKDFPTVPRNDVILLLKELKHGALSSDAEAA